MPRMGDWEATQSDGTLNIDRPATQWRYRKYVSQLFSLDYLAAFGIAVALGVLGGGVPVIGQSIVSQTFTGDWKIRLKLGESILFEQTVTLSLFLVAQVNVALGGLTLGFYSWQYLKEVITTTIIDGQPTDKHPTSPNPNNPAWKHTRGNTEFSEFGSMEAGSGNSFTDAGGEVTDWWDSPVYMTRLPVGTKLEIVMDAFQARIRREPLYQFQFAEAGGKLIDTCFDPIGAKLYAAAKGGRPGVWAGRTWPGHESRQQGGYVTKVTDPCIIDLRNGRQIMGGLLPDGWSEWQSLDSEITWTPVLYPDPVTLVPKAQPVFAGSVNVPSVVVVGDVRLHIAVTPDGLVSRRVTDEGPGELRRVGPANVAESYSITSDGAGTAYIDDSTRTVYKSRDGGIMWEPVGEAVATVTA